MQSSHEFEKYGFCMSWGDLRRDVHAVGVPLRLVWERGNRRVQLRDAIFSGEAGSDQLRYRPSAGRHGARARRRIRKTQFRILK